MSPKRQPPEPLPELLTREDLAGVLKVHPRTVDRMWKDHLLPRPVLPGPGVKRWDREEIRAWIKAGCPAWEVWRGIKDKSEV